MFQVLIQIHPVPSSEAAESSSVQVVNHLVLFAGLGEKTDKFHRAQTVNGLQKISDNNKIVYHSRQEALDSGRQPCEVCNLNFF